MADTIADCQPAHINSPDSEHENTLDEDGPEDNTSIFGLEDACVPFSDMSYGSQNLEASVSWIKIVQERNRKYDLRGKDRSNFRGSGWVDTDNSGNYNPVMDRVLRESRSRREKPAKIDEGEDDIPGRDLAKTKRQSSMEIDEEEDKSPAPKRRRRKTAVQMRTSTATNNHNFCRGKETNKQKRIFERVRKRSTQSQEASYLPEVVGGTVKRIKTSFCHPIYLNWDPPPPLSLSTDSQGPSSDFRPSSFPCHFCTDPGISYALVGLGNQEIEVIQWNAQPDAGYEELEFGWSSRGEETTRMCKSCTMERLLICTCNGHEFRPIAGLDPATFDFSNLIQNLLDSMKPHRGGSAKDETKWCSICLDAAFYECCYLPNYNKSGTATSPSDTHGCGLQLCEVCFLRMTGARRQDFLSATEPIKDRMTLDEHITAATKDQINYPDGLRADVGFLNSDGEIMRRLQSLAAPEADVEPRTGTPEGDYDEFFDYDSIKEEVVDRGIKKGSWGMGEFVDLT